MQHRSVTFTTPGLFPAEAAKEFAGARKKALLRRIGAYLRRRPSSNRMLSFDEATKVLGPWRQFYLGRWTVPVERIVGSEGRYADFDGESCHSKTARRRNGGPCTRRYAAARSCRR